MLTTTRKDVAKSVKTLLVMLQSMRQRQVTITMRNDTIVRGTIIKVDASMNIELQDATIEPDPFYCTSDLIDATTAATTTTTTTTTTTADDEARDSSGDELDEQPDQIHHDQDDPSDDERRGEQQRETCPYFVVKGSRVRHIDIPEGLDLMASTRLEIERIRNRRKPWTKRSALT